MKIYVISDLHGNLDGLNPKGVDLVLVAGDFSRMSGWGPAYMGMQLYWVEETFCKWCAKYPRTQFRVVPGNHDLFAEHADWVKTIAWPSNVKLLIDEADEVNGLKIYGSPWVPFINGYWAFEEKRLGLLKERFAEIPKGLDVLLTHSPPRLEGSDIDMSLDTMSPHFGSKDLTVSIRRAKPRYVFCGHIHTGDHNPATISHADGSMTIVRNVSRLDEDYKIRYDPFVFEV